MSAAGVTAAVVAPSSLVASGRRSVVRAGSNSTIDDAIVVASSLLLIGSFFWVPAGTYVLYKKYCTTRRRKVIFLLAIVGILAVPLPEWRGVTRLALWDKFLRYFSGEAVGDIANTHGNQALYCLVPHGVFPFGIGLSSLGKLNHEVFNDLRPIVASAIHRMPVIGQILQLIGAVEAGPASVKAALESGVSLGLAPGGIGEIYWGYPRPGCHSDQEYALLKGRLGFVRRALETGVPLVPVYVFNNSKTFKRAMTPAIIESLARRLKTSIVLFWGRWGLPVPFKVPLTFAVGSPIEVVRTPSPTNEQVAELHKRFCNALVEVFDVHKGDFGWAHKTLELV